MANHGGIFIMAMHLISYNSLVWFVGFYGISTFIGYLMPNSFLYK